MKIFIPAMLLASTITLVIGLFAGCGGGSGSSEKIPGFSIGGTGVTAAGQITGFGSVFVNGIEFDTGSATVSLDGNASTESDLRLGMFVKIDGTIDATGMGGKADTIVFDDDIQGPITAISTGPDGLVKTLSVLGNTVIADSTSTAFDAITFSTLAINDVIEVSGFTKTDSSIQATRIEKKETFIPGNSEVELKGIVNGLSGPQFALGSITINFSAADLSGIAGGLISNNQRVEVKGTLTGSTIAATRVEEEDDLFGDSADKVSLEGTITNYVNDGNFFIAGQLVNASSAQRKPISLILVDGARIEMEGPIINGILEATEVEARGGNIKLKAKVSAVNTVTLLYIPGFVSVQADTQTKLQDENGPITLSALNAGTDFVAIDAYIDGNGNLIANDISVKNNSDDDTIQGPVDSFVSDSNITVLGLTFNTNTSTVFELTNDTAITSSTFYSTLNNGDVVKIEDNKSVRDGIADEVEFEG